VTFKHWNLALGFDWWNGMKGLDLDNGLMSLALGLEIILQDSTLLLLIIKVFICEIICKSDMCGALVLVLFLRNFAWWVVLGSKPMDPLTFYFNVV
jgi:hypothetical protein